MTEFEFRLKEELIVIQNSIREKIEYLEKNSHHSTKWWEEEKRLESLFEKRNKILEYIPEAGLTI